MDWTQTSCTCSGEFADCTSTGVFWLKIDGVMGKNVTNMCYRDENETGNDLSHIAWPSNPSGAYSGTCNIWIDDMEIWDGIPQTTSYKVSTTLPQTGQPELLNGIPNITNNAVSTTLPQTDQSELFKWMSVLIIILALLYFVWAKQYL